MHKCDPLEKSREKEEVFFIFLYMGRKGVDYLVREVQFAANPQGNQVAAGQLYPKSLHMSYCCA